MRTGIENVLTRIIITICGIIPYMHSDCLSYIVDIDFDSDFDSKSKPNKMSKQQLPAWVWHQWKWFDDNPTISQSMKVKVCVCVGRRTENRMVQMGNWCLHTVLIINLRVYAFGEWGVCVLCCCSVELLGLPSRLVRCGRTVIVLTAAYSCSRTGCDFAPHESLPIQMKWPVLFARMLACSNFLEFM